VALLALIPVLVLLLLALRPQSRFRNWCRVSYQDFWGLFSPIRQRRHVIHDQPYLDQVLRAEFVDDLLPSGSPPSPVSQPLRDSSEATTAPLEIILSPADKTRNRSS